jgi:putative flippase GtrA
MAEPWSKRKTGRREAAGVLNLLRRLGWLTTIALAGVWVGLGFVPDLSSNLIWFSRAAIFFIGAAVIWFSYDPSEDPGA